MNEFYVVWHSVAGFHGLHGPYDFAEARALVKLPEAPAGAVVVKVSKPRWLQ